MPEARNQKSVIRNQHSEIGGHRLNSAKDLQVYQLAYQLAMDVFHWSLKFPAEEKFALTSQIRRSSRSVCLNLREAWAKRRYEAHFISKLTDCDGENSETDSSLDFAKNCGYLTEAQHQQATDACRQIGRMLGGMLANPQSFLISTP
jgi:four helix bundle protein